MRVARAHDHRPSEGLYALGYISFHVGFELTRVLCAAQGARCIAATRCQSQPRFAAVSGLTTTVTLVLQTVLQLVFFKSSKDFPVLAAILFALFLAYVAAACTRAVLRRMPLSRGGEPRAPAQTTASMDAPDSGRPYVQYRDH